MGDRKKETFDDMGFDGEEIRKDKEEDITDLTEEDMPTQMFEGERIGIEDVLDENIVIRDMTTRPSSFSEGEYAIIQIEKDGEPYVILTGASVLMRQIREKADKLPIRCRIIEQQSTRTKYKYYILVPPTKSKYF
ncbi:MAG: hypothetical protein EF807_01565 [Candidatus Methanolliviera hydrocarbonicum]|uniref:Uncharacterized protein n=1 Tax=Candidatus Methanolliviera hydrocarbonicum TaxID=2491085 RepID=A0A520KYB2_9EURY|nr:MAG: hypothetical protein EF807_01565 [Candidatus Methanolliviera hydrocarbonicum]